MRYIILAIILILSIQAYSQKKTDFKIITSDIDNFYISFNLAKNDSVNAIKIFDKYYFKKGTKGLRDFYKFKIKDKQIFSKNVLKGKDFYSSIENDMKQVKIFEDEIMKNFLKFKEIYPKAKFGNVYFVIGRLNSNGTISKNGLIIGSELLSKTEKNSTSWNQELQNWILDFNHIPVTVFHEMIHFNQNGMVKENNLLSYALREGSAEFLTELFTGKTDGSYISFNNREIKIWEDFEKEMYLDIYDSWHKSNEPLRPRNALYWIGYIICKSYYEQTENKTQAIYDILNIKNHTKFYNQSKITEYIKNNYR
jgi:hypothetical protein